MASRLSESITSELIKAESAFRPSGAPPHVVIYVEDDIDICFWESQLSKYNSRIDFSISNIKDNSGNDIYGKNYLFNNSITGKYGSHLWACIDSDYDYIIDNWNNHDFYLFIRESPFVISTIAYSIENLKCSPQNLNQLYHKTVLTTENDVCFDSIIESFSSIISPILYLNLISESEKDGEYPLKQFKSDLNKFKYSDDYKKKWKEQVNLIIAEHNDYYNKKTDSIVSIRDKCASLDFCETSSFYVVQGHVFESLAIEWLYYFCKKKYSQRISELKKNPNPDVWKKYRNQVLNNCNGLRHRVVQVVHDCNTVQEPMSLKIQTQIENAINFI